MVKKVIRKQIVQGISSKIIQESDNDETLQTIALKRGIEYVLQKIFDEKELSYQMLSEEYYKFVQTGSSSLFSWMYVIDSKFGIVIDEHIYLYHYNFDISNPQSLLFPWEYVDSKKYLGDTWWSGDDEVLEDIKKLSILEFLEKYKGY